MHNRIDKTLTSADIQEISDAVTIIHDKISTGAGLTTAEWKKGGWYLSDKSLLFLEEALKQAKLKPANFPSIDLAAFERDVKLIKQLSSIESKIMNHMN